MPDTPDTATGWAEVGRHIRERIDALQLTKAEVIRRSNISDKTLARYIEGEPIVRRDKERGLCAALRWAPESIEQILAGGEPVLVPESEEVGSGDETPDVLARLEKVERMLADLMAERRKGR